MKLTLYLLLIIFEKKHNTGKTISTSKTYVSTFLQLSNINVEIILVKLETEILGTKEIVSMRSSSLHKLLAILRLPNLNSNLLM